MNRINKIINLTLERRVNVSKPNKKKSTIAKGSILKGLLYIGLVAGGFMSYNFLDHNIKDSKKPVSQKTPTKINQTYNFKNLDNWEIPKEYNAFSKDPFIIEHSIKPTEVYSEKFTLIGIVGSEDKESTAIIGTNIGTKIYHKGDVVGDNTLTEINIGEGYIEFDDGSVKQVSKKSLANN